MAQLARQRLWYVEPWRHLLRRHVLPEYGGRRPTALDVGCGPGLVMESLADLLVVQGLDVDPDMVGACQARGLMAAPGNAEDLPFEDGAFDVAYCSFLLVWTPDPAKAIGEMLRVSRRWVLCLAEPDYGARVDYPPELEELTSLIVEGARAQGGDPFMGRRLRSLFSGHGIEAEVGVHPGVFSLERWREESAAEWDWIEGMVGSVAGRGELARLRTGWDQALGEGSLFQSNPTFYALARKQGVQAGERGSRQR